MMPLVGINVIAGDEIIIGIIQGDPVNVAVQGIVLHKIIVGLAVQHDAVQPVVIGSVGVNFVIEAPLGKDDSVIAVIVCPIIGNYQVIGVIVRIYPILYIVENVVIFYDESGSTESIYAEIIVVNRAPDHRAGQQIVIEFSAGDLPG